MEKTLRFCLAAAKKLLSLLKLSKVIFLILLFTKISLADISKNHNDDHQDTVKVDNHINYDDPVQFNSNFLGTDSDHNAVDLSLFSYPNKVLPGIYLVDVVINQLNTEQIKLRFDFPDTKSNLVHHEALNAKPCLTMVMLHRWGIIIDSVNEIKESNNIDCVDLTKIIANSKVEFDVGQLRLYISVPQIFMRRIPRGYVSPEQWDSGINVGFLNYRLDASRSSYANSGHDNSFSASIQSGLNIGSWRLRQRSYYNSDNKTHPWKYIDTFAQRELVKWRSRIILGDSYTSMNAMENFSIRGVQLLSDESMLPDSQRGYAPTIYATASTNAKIVVKQNNYEIYRTEVAPGPFVIEDLLPISSNGDLEVIILEADGSKKVLIYPYSAAITQVRAGFWRYALAAGKYRSNTHGTKQPFVTAGNLAYGLNSKTTIYTGLIASSVYQAALFGAGFNLGKYGAVNLDVTHTRSRYASHNLLYGQALKLSYFKTYLPTSTSFRISAYRYASENFRTFAQTIKIIDTENLSKNFRNTEYLRASSKHRIEININQQIARGTFNLNFISDKHWNDGSRRAMGIGYNNIFRNISYSLQYSYGTYKINKHMKSVPNKSLSFSISIPFDIMRNKQILPRESNSIYQYIPKFINYNVNSNFSGDVRHNIGVSGYLKDNNLSYVLGVSKSNVESASQNVALNYNGSYASIGLSHSRSHVYANTNATISGGIVAHSSGLTFGQYLSETAVLVSAPGATGMSISNTAGITIDSRGYAVVPYATAYRVNNIAIEPNNLPANLEFKNTALNVIPTRGAIAIASFETRYGYKVLLKLTDELGKPLPFGAKVQDMNGKEAGIVGVHGQAYITGVPAEGKLLVKFGGKNKNCTVKYILPLASTENKAGKINGKLAKHKIAQPTTITVITTAAKCLTENKEDNY